MVKARPDPAAHMKPDMITQQRTGKGQRDYLLQRGGSLS